VLTMLAQLRCPFYGSLKHYCCFVLLSLISKEFYFMTFIIYFIEHF
jgi:hypothetical protein